MLDSPAYVAWVSYWLWKEILEGLGNLLDAVCLERVPSVSMLLV